MRANEFTSKLNESMLITDVPNEDWLAGKVEYAKSKGRDSYGVPYMGSTTGVVKPELKLPVSLLKKLPGMRGEQRNVRDKDLKAIMKIMKDTGKLPLKQNGEEYAPFVMVAYNGEAWVNEGNHRIMAAAALGWDELPVELKYFDGGERIRSGVLYPGKIGLGDVKNSHETDEDPLVVVYDSDGELHTHANLSVANNIFRTRVKPNDVFKGPVKVKSGGSYGEVTFDLSKHHKSDATEGLQPNTSVVMNEVDVDEAESGTPEAKKITQQLKDAGYKQLGSGADATVWSKDEGQVIKVIMPDSKDITQAAYVFKKFYEFCTQHKDLACLPKFIPIQGRDYVEFKLGNKNYIQVSMEQLYPIKEDSFAQGIVWFFSDYVSNGVKWDKVDDLLGYPQTWYEFHTNKANQFAEKWQNLSMIKGNERKHSEMQLLYTVMELLYRTGKINKMFWDLHTDNAMQRKDGTIVIIDPWFERYEGTL